MLPIINLSLNASRTKLNVGFVPFHPFLQPAYIWGRFSGTVLQSLPVSRRFYHLLLELMFHNLFLGLRLLSMSYKICLFLAPICWSPRGGFFFSFLGVFCTLSSHLEPKSWDPKEAVCLLLWGSNLEPCRVFFNFKKGSSVHIARAFFIFCSF